MATFCDMAYTWDANKNKTSESITGVMSGYGFTAAGTTYDNEDRLTGFSRAATSGPALLSQSWSLTAVGDYPVGGAATTPTFRYVYASYIDEPVVRKTAGTGGTLVYFHRSGRCPVPGRQNAPGLSTFKDSVLLADSLFFNAFDITHRPSLVEERFSRGVKSEVGEPAFTGIGLNPVVVHL